MELATARPESLWAWMPRRGAARPFSGVERLEGRRVERVSRTFETVERAAVGVAEDERGGAGLAGASQDRKRVVRVVLEAVEEVLGVEDDLAAVGLEERDGLGDHVEVLLRGGAEHFAHVQLPALAEDRRDGRLRAQERLHELVLLHARAGAARRPERGDAYLREPLLRDVAEELHVALVGAGEAALEVGHAEVVEQVREADLAGGRERDAERLRAVAQRGVVEHGGPAVGFVHAANSSTSRAARARRGGTLDIPHFWAVHRCAAPQTRGAGRVCKWKRRMRRRLPRSCSRIRGRSRAPRGGGLARLLGLAG